MSPEKRFRNVSVLASKKQKAQVDVAQPERFKQFRQHRDAAPPRISIATATLS